MEVPAAGWSKEELVYQHFVRPNYIVLADQDSDEHLSRWEIEEFARESLGPALMEI
jgi:hypothetical protein